MAKKNDTTSFGDVLGVFVALFTLLYLGIKLCVLFIIFIINCFIVFINFILFIINLFIRDKSRKIKYIHIIRTNGMSNDIQASNEILFSFDSDNEKEEAIDDIDEQLEKEMDAYNLEEWQKELVRKGEYDPSNFEEDGNLEEDDYYYEDGK